MTSGYKMFRFSYGPVTVGICIQMESTMYSFSDTLYATAIVAIHAILLFHIATYS